VDGERLVRVLRLGYRRAVVAGSGILAFSMLPWGARSRRRRRVHRPRAGEGGPDAGERSQRFHLLLDAYGPSRATVRCSGRWCRSEPGDRPKSSGRAGPRLAIRRPSRLLPIAGLLESSAVDVEALPRDFWLR